MTRFGRWLPAAAAALALLATAACGGGGGSARNQETAAAPVTDRPVELSMAWWGGPKRAELTQQVIDLYMREHPNVTITTQWQGYSGYYDKINTSAAGRNAPDIIQIDNRVLREYSSKGLIADLTPYVGTTLQTDGIDQRLLSTGEVDGTLFAVPAASNAQSFVVDRTVVEPLGLLPPETGWATWDEFGAWAAQVSAATGGKPWGVRDESADLGSFEFWLRQQGKNLYDGQRLGFTEADATAWFDMWARFRQSGAASPAEVSQPANSGDIAKNTVITKNTAVTFSWDNQFTEVNSATDHDLMLVPLPGPPSGAYARSSQYFTAYTGGDNIANAVDVINFFVNDPEAGAILGTERGLPPNDQVRAAIEPNFSEELKYVVAYDERVTSQAGETPPVPAQGDAQVRQLLITSAENAAFGRLTTAAAAAEFFSQSSAALERASS